MPNDLPGFTYDPATGEYYHKSNGKPVVERRIKELLALLLLLASARLGELATAFVEKRIASSVWAEQVGTDLLRQHLILAALGAGGWAQLTEDDYARVQSRMDDDRQRVAGTANDVVIGAITLAVALARVNAYVGSARTQFYDAERSRLQRSASNMIMLERRILGNAMHCNDCIIYYNMGWQPVGTLPSPGMDSICGGACRCDMIYTEVPAVEVGAWLNTQR